MNDELPDSVTRFKGQLTDAIASELGRSSSEDRRRRHVTHRRRALAGTVAVCAVAGAVIAAALTVSATSRSSAWSAHVLRAAEIALPRPEPNTILHVSVTQTMTPAARRDTTNTAVPVLNAEGWFQQGSARRQVVRETVPGRAPVWESGGTVYRPAVQRLYVLPPLPNGHPRFTLMTASRSGFDVLRVVGPHHHIYRQTVTTAEAHALRSGADEIEWAESWNGHRASLAPLIGPTTQTIAAEGPAQPNDTSLTFPAQLHRLLQSGHARVKGHVRIDGRAAIEIELLGAGGRLFVAYYVDPTTYRPIELDRYAFNSTHNVTRLVFHAYQTTPVRGNGHDLRLPAPDGTPVDHNADDFYRSLPPPLFW